MIRLAFILLLSIIYQTFCYGGSEDDFWEKCPGPACPGRNDGATGSKSNVSPWSRDESKAYETNPNHDIKNDDKHLFERKGDIEKYNAMPSDRPSRAVDR